MLQKGFTLIELMIVVAIIGILSMFALPAYQDYTKRTYVSEGMALSTAAKMAATEYFSTEGKWPITNSQAGIAAGNQITGQAVSAIWLTAGNAAVSSGAATPSNPATPAGGTTNINIFYNDKVVTGAPVGPTSKPADGTAVENNAVKIAPTESSTAGSIVWNCTAAGAGVLKKWLPANCRNAF